MATFTQDNVENRISWLMAGFANDIIYFLRLTQLIIILLFIYCAAECICRLRHRHRRHKRTRTWNMRNVSFILYVFAMAFGLIGGDYCDTFSPKISQRPHFMCVMTMFAFICSPFCSNWLNTISLIALGHDHTNPPEYSRTLSASGAYSTVVGPNENEIIESKRNINENGFQMVLYTPSFLRTYVIPFRFLLSFLCFVSRNGNRATSIQPAASIHQTLISRGI